MTDLFWSEKEVDRITVINQVENGRLRQNAGARMLGISERQLRRLQKEVKIHGPAALRSKRRGHRSNNHMKEDKRTQIVEIIRSRYSDFGPSMAQEKLLELHSISISVETVRKLMIAEGIWIAGKRRKPRIHQSRYRRERYGELIQIDGSPHKWFEERAPRCCLIGFIDDATSRIQYLRFVEAETTEAYLEALEWYVLRYGRPEAIYSDKHSVFRVNTKGEGYKGEGTTQFGRALKELGVDLICANSPQAKGRVERMFGTLQDRLTKELRLAGLSGIKEGNEFLASFMESHNRRFAVSALEEGNSHRALLSGQKLDRVICIKEARTISKNLEFSYEGDLYQVITDRPTYAMRGGLVEIQKRPQGEAEFRYKGQQLECKKLITRDGHGRIESRKALSAGAPPPRGGANSRQAA